MPLTPKQIDAIALYHIKPGAMVIGRRISAALNNGLTVLCDLRASGTKGLAVRDVRSVQVSAGCQITKPLLGRTATQVLTLEGWREPLRVWTKEQPEPSFARQVQSQNNVGRLL